MRPHATQSNAPCHCDGSPPELTPSVVMRRRHAGFPAAGRVSKGCALLAAVEAGKYVTQ